MRRRARLFCAALSATHKTASPSHRVKLVNAVLFKHWTGRLSHFLHGGQTVPQSRCVSALRRQQGVWEDLATRRMRASSLRAILSFVRFQRCIRRRDDVRWCASLWRRRPEGLREWAGRRAVRSRWTEQTRPGREIERCLIPAAIAARRWERCRHFVCD